MNLPTFRLVWFRLPIFTIPSIWPPDLGLYQPPPPALGDRIRTHICRVIMEGVGVVAHEKAKWVGWRTVHILTRVLTQWHGPDN